MFRFILFLITHGAALGIGFAFGIYFLPILTQPTALDPTVLAEKSASAIYIAEFERGQPGNDFLHWGEGKVSISPKVIVHQGELAPGPDYKLYLVKDFVEDEKSFLALKDTSQVIGDVKTFKGFALNVPENVDISQFTTVLVWCETFSEFITSAQYR